jgi:hypothetical protein
MFFKRVEPLITMPMEIHAQVLPINLKITSWNNGHPITNCANANTKTINPRPGEKIYGDRKVVRNIHSNPIALNTTGYGYHNCEEAKNKAK